MCIHVMYLFLSSHRTLYKTMNIWVDFNMLYMYLNYIEFLLVCFVVN